MIRRLWLALLCALAAATLAGPAAAQPWGVRAPLASLTAQLDVAAERTQPTAGVDATPLSSDLLAATRAELLTVVARVLPTGATVPDEDAARATAGCALRLGRATGWCDVVQCRRWAGAQLLRYATAPPARA